MLACSQFLVQIQQGAFQVRGFGLRPKECALILEMVASDCQRHVGNEFVLIEADGLGVGGSGPQKSVLGAQQERMSCRFTKG
jgi:hypothetical protein